MQVGLYNGRKTVVVVVIKAELLYRCYLEECGVMAS